MDDSEKWKYEAKHWRRLYESTREPKHHEMWLSVTRELVRAVGERCKSVDREAMKQCVDGGRYAADLAYPPPKAEGT